MKHCLIYVCLTVPDNKAFFGCIEYVPHTFVMEAITKESAKGNISGCIEECSEKLYSHAALSNAKSEGPISSVMMTIML